MAHTQLFSLPGSSADISDQVQHSLPLRFYVVPDPLQHCTLKAKSNGGWLSCEETKPNYHSRVREMNWLSFRQFSTNISLKINILFRFERFQVQILTQV